MLDWGYGDFLAVYRLPRAVSMGAGLKLGAGPMRPLVPPDRSLVMIGLMGAGKSAIGRRLAHRLELPFHDADAEVEAAAGCSIAEIFSRHGEQVFRDGERRVIARLLNSPPQVLATGGGAFLEPETRSRIRRKGISVWLRATLDVLVARVKRRSHRPLLRGGNPREILGRLMAERYPVYAEADITVESVDGPHDEVVDAIVSALEAYHGADARQEADRA